MTARLLALTFDVDDPAVAAAFWAALLDREPVQDGDGVLLPHDVEVGLRLAQVTGPSSGRDAHLHLSSQDEDDQRSVVDRCLELGAEHLHVGQLPEEGHVVLRVPGGTVLCVIEPRNSYLDGCGFLAEIAGDGTREVGLFWADVLGWPLVWDRDGETVVQSPAGGTKVAWGGPPVQTKHGRNRHRFELVADDVATEADRLVRLGARRLRDRPGYVELVDPDGNEFLLRALCMSPTSGDRAGLPSVRRPRGHLTTGCQISPRTQRFMRRAGNTVAGDQTGPGRQNQCATGHYLS